jgi:hypothetical protein
MISCLYAKASVSAVVYITGMIHLFMKNPHFAKFNQNSTMIAKKQECCSHFGQLSIRSRVEKIEYTSDFSYVIICPTE